MDNPDQVQVRAIQVDQSVVLELRVHHSDFGKLIGRQGRTGRAVTRAILLLVEAA